MKGRQANKENPKHSNLKKQLPIVGKLRKWVAYGLKNREIILSKMLRRTGFCHRTLWDLLDLLIVPVVLTGGVLYVRHVIDLKQAQIIDKRAKRDQEISNVRYQRETEVCC